MVDERLESYQSFYDHQWAEHIISTLEGAKFYQAGFDLCASWKGTANARSLPWLLVESIREALEGYIQVEKPIPIRLHLGFIELINTKNNKKRYPTLNKTAIDCLSGIERTSEFVFIGTQGQRLKSVKRVWARVKKVAQIDPSFRFHNLRHTYISHSIMRGVDLFTIARQVGHSDLRMIEQRYGHLLAEHRKNAVNVLDGMFAPEKNRSYIAPGAKILNLGEAGST